MCLFADCRISGQLGQGLAGEQVGLGELALWDSREFRPGSPGARPWPCPGPLGCSQEQVGVHLRAAGAS